MSDELIDTIEMILLRLESLNVRGTYQKLVDFFKIQNSTYDCVFMHRLLFKQNQLAVKQAYFLLNWLTLQKFAGCFAEAYFCKT